MHETVEGNIVGLHRTSLTKVHSRKLRLFSHFLTNVLLVCPYYMWGGDIHFAVLLSLSSRYYSSKG